MAITDLTNTTWRVPSGWSVRHGYGDFAIDYMYIRLGSVPTMDYASMLRLGFDNGSGDNGDDCIGFDTFSIYSSVGFNLEITGGTDTTNPKLIAWLLQYGEMRGGEEEQPALTKKFTRLHVGATVITNNGRSWRKLSDTEYVELPTLSAPTIEISDTTLNIYDEEGIATSYDILVDGEVKATVEKGA